LHLDGFDTRAAPLIERKRVLQSFLAEAATKAPCILYSEHFEDGADLYARAIGMSEHDWGRCSCSLCRKRRCCIPRSRLLGRALSVRSRTARRDCRPGFAASSLRLVPNRPRD
jgi:hypothetical protein